MPDIRSEDPVGPPEKKAAAVFTSAKSIMVEPAEPEEEDKVEQLLALIIRPPCLSGNTLFALNPPVIRQLRSKARVRNGLAR